MASFERPATGTQVENGQMTQTQPLTAPKGVILLEPQGTRFCTVCGIVAQPTHRFCGGCGKQL